MHETFESLWVTEWLGWVDGLLISYSENAFQISELDQVSLQCPLLFMTPLNQWAAMHHETGSPNPHLPKGQLALTPQVKAATQGIALGQP